MRPMRFGGYPIAQQIKQPTKEDKICVTCGLVLKLSPYDPTNTKTHEGDCRSKLQQKSKKRYDDKRRVLVAKAKSNHTA